MAISTYKTYLMKGTPGTGSTVTWAKLIDIVNFPDLGGSPETIDVTSLSDPMRVFIDGVKSNGLLSFNANYDHTQYAAVKQLEGTETMFSVWFGATTESDVDTPTGSDGKFDFKGKPSVRVTGGGVNEGVKMVVDIVPTTKITDATA